MMEGLQNLGQRIVEAARLAVAVHLYESVAQGTVPNGAALRVATQLMRRHVETGGAGSSEAGDGLPSSRLGDLVTDDERDGLIGTDSDRDFPLDPTDC